MKAMLAVFCITLTYFGAPVASAEHAPRAKPAKELKAPPATSPPSAAPAPTAAPSGLKPSQLRFKPLPKPVPPPRQSARRVTIRPRSTAPVVLTPVTKKAAKPEPLPVQGAPSFELSKSAAGKLTLRFRPRKPDEVFDIKAPFVIQLNAPEPLRLQPSVITRSEWPASRPLLEIAYQGATPGKPQQIQGEAAYTVCRRGTKQCARRTSLIEFTLR